MRNNTTENSLGVLLSSIDPGDQPACTSNQQQIIGKKKTKAIEGGRKSKRKQSSKKEDGKKEGKERKREGKKEGRKTCSLWIKDQEKRTIAGPQ